MKKKTPKEIIEKQLRTEEDIDNISTGIAKKMPNDMKVHRKLTDIQLIDVGEVLGRGILNNQTRRECLSHAAMFLSQYEIEVGKDISEQYIINIYNNVRKALTERSLGSIEEERQRYINAMHSVSSRCLNQDDHANFIKAQKEIADIAGVLEAKDDSKIIINFSAATKKEEK